MAYTANILPKEPAYYTIQNASITNGQLNLSPGSILELNIDNTRLASIPKTFLFNYEIAPLPNPLKDEIIFYLDIVMEDGVRQSISIYPTGINTNIQSYEIVLKDGTFTSFHLRIESKINCIMPLWELCPEASDTDTEVIIDGVKQSLPRLLFDYNTWPLEVNRIEQTVALITFYLRSNTDLQGHFLMSYYAYQSCTLTLRFKDTETTELFAPVTYDLSPGKGSVSVPHSYLKRLAGVHSVIVTAQVSRGKLDIDTRDILFTIDGGYLAERMMDIGADVRDISIRQLSEDYGPDEIWIIGIEAGVATVRKREYSTNATIAFEPQFQLGQARKAAIEFDGVWLRRLNQDVHTIETEELPWVFWTDMDYNLYAQWGNVESTKILLDTNVTDISVIRGYKSVYYPEQDQGLICAYIKNHKVYYRSYSYNTILKKPIWDTAYELPAINPIKVHVHRLNDYRVGFCITTPTNNFWYISDRTYVTQAVPDEHFEECFCSNNSLAVRSSVDTPTYPFDIKVEATVNKENNSINIISNYPIKVYHPEEAIIFDRGLDPWLNLDRVIISEYRIDIYLKNPTYSGIQFHFIPDFVQCCIPNVGTYPIYPSSYLVSFFPDPKEHFEETISEFKSTLTIKPLSELRATYIETDYFINAVGNLETSIMPKKIEVLSINYDETQHFRSGVNNVTCNISIYKKGDEPI